MLPRAGLRRAGKFPEPDSRSAECSPRVADARERAGRIIDFLHLTPHVDRLAGTLPYGLQKRVELARALAAEPRILLLDEPMAGMTATRRINESDYVRLGT